MERGADRQKHRLAIALPLGNLDGTIDGRSMAGNNDLARRIVVGRSNDFALCRLGTNLDQGFRFNRQNRRHGPDSDRYGFLHEGTAGTTVRTASLKSMAPLQTRAEYSPRECPAR